MSVLQTVPEMRESITSGTRSNLVDIVKGIAIILVTLGHTAQGMVHREWWNTPSASFLHSLIYSFHMPAFFFVAGLFVHGSIERRGKLDFTAEKAKSILYPYLLFAVIYTALRPLIGRFEINPDPFKWPTFLVKLADGDASWFLFALFFCFMLALLTIALPDWLRFVLAVAIGVTPPFGPPLTNHVLRQFCFLAAGMWVGTRIYRVDTTPATSAIFGFVLLSAFQTVMIYRFGPATRWSYIGLGLTGTAGLFFLASLLRKQQTGHVLAWIGRASLAIFLLSAFAQGGTRVVLDSIFHTHEFWLQLLLPTTLATLLPAIVWYQQKRWRLGWLFYWPF
ncbi:MAG: acyltransferase family protein [Edaphobacter sp.]